MYVIQKGQVRITFDADLLSSQNVCSLKPDNQKGGDDQHRSKELLVEKKEGSYFGEWVLLGEHIDSLTAVAVGDVICSILTKENFVSVVGPFTKLSQDDQKYVLFNIGNTLLIIWHSELIFNFTRELELFFSAER